jgi:hypothetical protein
MAADGVVRSAEDVMWAGHQAGGSPNNPATSVELALTGLKLFDHATETAWPYGLPEWPAPRPGAALRAENRWSIPIWRRLALPSFTAVEDELAEGNAVVLTVGYIPRAWNRPDGVVDAEPGLKTVTNHAVLSVGVAGPASNTPGHIIKNSWGDAWGDRGYGLISRRYFDAYTRVAHVLEG